eukprot:sb/3475806/
MWRKTSQPHERYSCRPSCMYRTSLTHHCPLQSLSLSGGVFPPGPRKHTHHIYSALQLSNLREVLSRNSLYLIRLHRSERSKLEEIFGLQVHSGTTDFAEIQVQEMAGSHLPCPKISEQNICNF